MQTIVALVTLLALSLGSGIIYARALGPTGRGEQSAIGLWPYLVSGLSTLGMAPSLCYHTSRATRSEGGLLSAGSVLAVVAGSTAAAVGWLIVPHVLTRYSSAVIGHAQQMMLFAPVLSLGYVFRANLEARGKFSASNMSKIWPPACTLVGLLILLAFGHLTPVSANLALFIPAVLQTAWLGKGVWTRMSFDLSTVLVDVRTLLSYGLRSWATDVMVALSARVDQAMIIAFLSPAALGLYSIALTASRTLNVLHTSLNTVLFPKASGLGFDEALELVGRLTRISNILSTFGALVFITIIPIVLPILFGQAFAAAAGIVRLLTIETLLMGIASVLAQAFLATGRPSVVTFLQATWVATSMLFLTFLVPRLGINGAADALVLSSLLRLLATLACYPIVLHRRIPRLLPTATDFQYLLRKLDGSRAA